MLDEQGYIERFDSDDALGAIAGQPEQLEYRPELDLSFSAENIRNVVVAGMGGSALAAGMFRNWLADELPVPFEIVRGYDLPAYVDEHTLVICSSYSGNTEETLSCFEQAQARNALIISLSNGGALQEKSQAADISFVHIPDSAQPRMAVWYGLKIMTLVFERLGLIQKTTGELAAAKKPLVAAAGQWGKGTPAADNRAKQIAEEMMGKAVWVYAGPSLASAAYKWKISLNENAKNVASWNELPEFNHNEFIGWTSHPVEKPFAVVELQSSLDHPQVQKRFRVSNRLLSGQMPPPITVEAEGQTQIQQLLWVSLLGDFASVYLGVLNGVNPTRVEAIEKLKQEL